MHANSQRQLSALLVALGLGLTRTAGAVSGHPPDQALSAVETLAHAALARDGNAAERAHVHQLFAALEKEHPRDSRVKNAYAEFLWDCGENDAAVRRWRDAAALDPRNAIVLNHLGAAHLRAGDARAAFRCFTDASSAEPTNPLYHFNLANVAFLFRHDLGIAEEKAFALALEHFADASQRAPTDVEYARAYAEAFYTVPDADWCTALAAWQHYYELTPKKDFALLNLARVHMKLGQKAEARDCLSRVTGQEFARIKTRLNERIDRE
jgi:tetratricopeptide (TPR) repeat protein